MIAEFVSYIITPNEKYVGIASVKIYGKILLRYKVVQRTDGSSVFFAAPSLRIPSDDSAEYVPSFIIDSHIDEEEVFALIRKNIKPASNISTSVHSSYSRTTPLPASTFDEVPF